MLNAVQVLIAMIQDMIVREVLGMILSMAPTDLTITWIPMTGMGAIVTTLEVKDFTATILSEVVLATATTVMAITGMSGEEMIEIAAIDDYEICDFNPIFLVHGLLKTTETLRIPHFEIL